VYDIVFGCICQTSCQLQPLGQKIYNCLGESFIGERNESLLEEGAHKKLTES
jgi:hypothetical protein